MWKRMKDCRSEEGFTLIELLIVVVILAILAAIVVFAVGTTTTNAKQAACNADAKSVEGAVEAYKAQTGSFPATGPAGQAELTSGASNPANGPWLRQWPIATVTNNGYAITLDGSTAGVVDVTTAGGTIDYDTQTIGSGGAAGTGCNSIT